MDFLSVTWNVDPVLFKIGSLSIRYYSLLFVAGFPFGYWLFTKFFRREGVNEEILEPLLYLLLFGTVVGARLGHCLFYEPAYYLSNPLEIIKVWHGGLASHGGAIALVLCILWYAKKYGAKEGFNALWVFDRLVITICFAGCLIRLGNLMNSEIFGDATNLPWGFRFVNSYEWVSTYGPKAFPPDGTACHPTQIYEALCYLILGFLLIWLYQKKSDKIYRGFIFGLFFIGCFGSRFLIEFIKNDQVGFEQGMTLNMGQLLSIPFVLAGIGLVVASYRLRQPVLLEKKPESAAPKGDAKTNIDKSQRMSRAKRRAAGLE